VPLYFFNKTFFSVSLNSLQQKFDLFQRIYRKRIVKILTS